MRLLKNYKTKKALKEIENEVDKKLMDMNLLKIENGKKIYATGSCHTSWEIQKKLLKEKYNIDWKSPEDKNANINFD